MILQVDEDGFFYWCAGLTEAEPDPEPVEPDPLADGAAYDPLLLGAAE